MIGKYIPDLKLLKTFDRAEHFNKYPLLAIFEFDEKNLIYIGSPHNPLTKCPEVFDAINYAFKKFNIDCVVTEIKHHYKAIEEDPATNLGKENANDLAYSVYIARKLNIPYIFADTNYQDWLSFGHNKSIIIQTMIILKNSKSYKKHFQTNETVEHAFETYKRNLHRLGYDTKLTIEQLKKSLEKNFAIDISDGTISKIPNIFNISNETYAKIYLQLRDPYMVKKIFKAVGKYENVLVTMGFGHYECQRLVFEKAFGFPKYLYNFPKSKRTDIL